MENNTVLAEKEAIEWQWNLIGIGFFLITFIIFGFLLKKDFSEGVFTWLVIGSSSTLVLAVLTTLIGFNVIN